MGAPLTTVLVCTYNPDARMFSRCLEALANQTLPLSKWELLIIDNASTVSVKDKFATDWHPNARHLVEPTVGKTNALLHGAGVAQSELLVIVDDDNVVAPDYLKSAVEVFTTNPFLGVAGGKIVGDFESPLPAWAFKYASILAIIDRGERDQYSCTPGTDLIPPGAGMVVRKSVVHQYFEQVQNDPIRMSLDPVGDQLSRGGDTDLALTAFDLRLAKGYFPALKMMHIIPSFRTTVAYLEELMEGTYYSDTLLRLIRGMVAADAPSLPAATDWRTKTVRYIRWRIAARRFTPEQMCLERAARRGAAAAVRLYRQHVSDAHA